MKQFKAILVSKLEFVKVEYIAVNEKHENKYLHVLLYPGFQGRYFSWIDCENK
ncbi:hypothetical protein GM418_17200 [Maribellus comscasis]|uniref:Uncharacterized protein n=1 Tax=Maribellus comscasis TaxID=2681766 RepID=A0A6I6JYM6_9BACT|nr:hypothetical protein [Maribellus comscasis]QGY45347.1 hypothetical protein GM418_17200 [Maribellus comscasis]